MRKESRQLCLTMALLLVPSLVLAIAPTSPPDQGSGGPFLHAVSLDVKPSLTRFGYDADLDAVMIKPGIRELFTRHGSDWEVLWDNRADLPNLIAGRGIPMIPGQGNSLKAGGPVTLDTVEQQVRSFMADNPQLFGAGAELRLRPEGSGNFGSHNQLWFIELQQYYNGVPVEEAIVFFRINNGNLVQFGNDKIGTVSIDTTTTLDQATTLKLALEALRVGRNQLAEVITRGDLKIYPSLLPGEDRGNRYEGAAGNGYGYRLVRETVFRLKDDPITYRALVDAHSHQVIDITDLNRYAEVKGGIYPESPLDTEVSRTFQAVTTSGDTTALNGQFTRISDNCGSISAADGDDGSVDGIIDLGMSGGTDCTTPGYGGAGNTHAARTGHYHLTNINRTAATFHPSNSWLATKLTANMNINNTCNAYWDGSSVNFYRSGGGCGNTGEIAAVFLHEWGHGMDENTGGGADQGTGETIGDTFAMIYLESSCIGAGFTSSPCYNCSSCTGVRDPADFSYHDGTATIATPATVTSNTGINCDRWSCPYYSGMWPYQGPMGYEGHCESYISSTAIWDLIVELRAAHGDSTGWDTMEQIWYDSLIPTKDAYQITSGGTCNPSASIDGCASNNFYQVFLSVDDDDGNLANGTPNACRIWDAFNYHGIACGSRPACAGGCTPSPIADAGSDQTICLGDSATIGTAAQTGHTYSWSPGGYTVAQPTVSPSVTTTYTVTATTSCGSATDSVTVTVDNGSGGGLNDSFEGSTSGWSTSGLWHLTSSSSCASPGYSSATHAFYYGQDSGCTYDTGSQTTGDLISPTIGGINSSSTLSFDYFRQVESYTGGSYDKTEVAIEQNGSGSWTTIWSRDSTDTSENAWTASGAISLAAYAGSNIRVRFHFDSVDSSYNTYTGWFIDDVVVTGESPCGGGNTPPSVNITAPTSGSSYVVGSSVSFSGTASDAEDGNLTSSLSWTSSRDGVIGSGGSFSTSSLSVGTHTITASVTDSGSLTGSDSIQVIITAVVNNPPVVTITAPSNGATYTVGDSVSFSGTATDTEDGSLTASLSWSSSLDGAIGSGGSFSTSSLSEGTHTITASVTDSGGLPGSDSIQVTMNPVSGCTSYDGPITVGAAATNGSLATTDCASTVRTSGNFYYDNYSFAATSGTTYTITLNSSAFDTYLYLLNGTTVLTYDDDGNGGTNSKIVYTPSSSATLTIHCTSYSANATGAYTVQVTGSTGGGELVTNGSFESGTSSWSFATYSTVTSGSAQDGSYKAQQLGRGTTTSTNFYQAIPGFNGATKTLRFYLKISSSEGTSYAYDYLYVRLKNTSGSTVSTLATYSNKNKSTYAGWTLVTLTVPSSALANYRISFDATEDYSVQTTFYIDNVSIQ